MSLSLSTEEVSIVLSSFSKSSGVPLDSLVPLYVYFGSDLFFLFDILAGKTVKFPRKNPVRDITERCKSRDDDLPALVKSVDSSVLINGYQRPAHQVKIDDVLTLDGVPYFALSGCFRFPAGNYVILRRVDSEDPPEIKKYLESEEETYLDNLTDILSADIGGIGGISDA